MPTLDNVNNLIKNVVNQYIVRPTGGRDTTGINGFVFDVIDDEEVMLDSDITDHYIEDNSAIQDHIALRPLRFTIRGYVAEITDLFPNTFIGLLTKVQSLASIGLFLPAFTYQATVFYANIAALASRVGQVLNQAGNLNTIINRASTKATKQQEAYNKFQSLWGSRQLCSVETPYGIFENMAIESVRALQAGNTRFISDFTVTFKQIRTVTTMSFSNPITNPNGSGTVQQTTDSSPLVNPPAANPPNGSLPPAQRINIQQTQFAGRTELLFDGRVKYMLEPIVNNGQIPGAAVDLNNVPYTPNILTPIFIPPIAPMMVPMI